LPLCRTWTSTASPSCSAARDTRITIEPQVRYNVRIIAGPGPGLSPALRRDYPLLVAVDGLATQPAATLRRLLAQAGGGAFFTDRRSTPPDGAAPAALPAAGADRPLLVLSGTHPAFAHLFLTVPEPKQGLWPALSHALTAYEAALADRRRTRIMGILNVTPDSFSDGGRYLDPGAAEERALSMIEAGAQILDVGGESTRPGAAAVPAEEELRRVLPVIQRLAGKIEASISVDTTKAAVAGPCLDAGATIVNDVSALTFDVQMARAVARAGATLILMHMPGTPRTMQQNPQYEDVVADTMRFLRRQQVVALKAGIDEKQLWIDPGFGFGKTVAQNLEILRRLREYTSVGATVLIGTSRKSTLGSVLGGLPADQRLEGTAATVAAAVLNGASVVRVHDVREMARVARVADAIMGREVS
jgi:dihydropteroate synthase